MKTFPFKLVLVSLLFLFSCVSTQVIPGSNKGDNTILIQTKESVPDAFMRMGQLLTSNGFAIANSDKNFWTITTEPRNTSKLNGSEKVTITVKGGDNAIIEMNGLIMVNASIYVGYGVSTVPSWNRISNSGMGGSLLQVGWNDLFNIAKQFPNATITFENRN